MKILLTGARGMAGRNIIEHPGAAAFEILAPASTDLDLRNYEAVRTYLATHSPDMVIHAAGKVGGIQANIREPVAFLVENLDMGRNIILAAHEAGIKRLLNLGSSCMYPRGCEGALQENMILTGALEPTNEGYAIAKIAVARLCEYVTRQDPVAQYKTLIPCNLYGRHDKFDPSRSHLIPAIIHKMHVAVRTGASAVDIWGSGQARREFMYAGDFADAVLRAVNDFDALPSIMNIGLGRDYSIDEYYAAGAKATGFRGEFIHDLDKPVGMMRKLVDISTQTDWGWAPSHSLEEGIAKTYSFYLKEYAQ